MSELNVKRQSGVSLMGLLVACVLIGLVAVLGIKVAPDVIEYFAVVKSVKATAMDPASVTGTVAEIRRNFDRRKSIDNVTAITGADLDISKEGNDIVIAFAYQKVIPLSGPVKLLLDFEGSSAK